MGVHVKKARSALRRLDPFLLRVRARELRPATRQRLRLVAAGQDLTPIEHLRRTGHTKTAPRLSIWGITIVRSDDDVLPCSVRHMIDQGVDRVAVGANLCTPRTWAVLETLARDLPVTIVRDDVPGFYQAEKMSRMAHAAAKAGADWIVPFDADELWFARDTTLRKALESTTARVVHGNIWNYVPSRHDDPSTTDPVARIQRREAVPAAMTKVAFRAHTRARLRIGNHGVVVPGSSTRGLEIAHFPYRSLDQLIEKATIGSAAMAATDLGDDACHHWRAMGTIDTNEFERRWEGLLDGRGLPDDAWLTGVPTVLDPIEYKRSWRDRVDADEPPTDEVLSGR